MLYINLISHIYTNRIPKLIYINIVCALCSSILYIYRYIHRKYVGRYYKFSNEKSFFATVIIKPQKNIKMCMRSILIQTDILFCSKFWYLLIAIFMYIYIWLYLFSFLFFLFLSSAI